MAKKQHGVEKLPNQSQDGAEALRAKSEEFVTKASDIKVELEKALSLDVSAMLIVFKPLERETKLLKVDKKLDLGEINYNITLDLAALKRFVEAHPEIEPYATATERVYLFPYGLPKDKSNQDKPH